MVARRGGRSRGSGFSLLLVTAVLWLGAGVCRFALPEAGLAGEYFSNAAWTGPTAHSEVDRDVSTAQLSRGWGFTPPDNFTIRWSGFLHVGSAGDYTFALNSDDGSTLYIDRSLVVDTAGSHGPPARSGRVHLDEGRHPMTLEYAQAGGAYRLEWSWAAGSEAASPVPAWRLSPHPARAPILFVQWAGALAWPFLSLALIVGDPHTALLATRASRSARTFAGGLPVAISAKTTSASTPPACRIVRTVFSSRSCAPCACRASKKAWCIARN